MSTHEIADSWTRSIVCVNPFGVTSQPTRAPVIAYVFEVEKTEKTRSSVSSEAGLTCGMPYVKAS